MQTRTHVLPNPIDLELYLTNSRLKPQAKKGTRTLLTVGTLRQEKNHTDLIEAFARLSAKYPDWVLRLVGEGELRPILEAQIKKLNIAANVQMPGTIKDVAAEYTNASIVVIPSLYESFGMVTVEALASGRAVIGFSDCTGTADKITHGKNGFLIDPGTDRVAALEKWLALLMDDPMLRSRLGKAGPSSIAHFDMDNALDCWEVFFKKMRKYDPAI